MHLAIAQDNLAAVQWLLSEVSVNPSCKNKQGETSLNHAIRRSRDSIAQAIALHPGVEVDLPDSAGRTPLSHAAELGLYATSHALLALNVDNQTLDHRWKTYACRSDNDAIAEVILAKGADLNTRDRACMTHLHHVGGTHNVLVAQKILSQTPDLINSKDRYDRSQSRTHV